MLTTQQLDDFEKLGIVRLPGAIAEEDTEVMRQKIWDVSGNYGMTEADRDSWVVIKPTLFNEVGEAGAFNDLGSDTVCAVLDDLFGKVGWQKPDKWGDVLFTIPNTKAWYMPTGGWHLDIPISVKNPHLDHVVVFAFLNAVKTQSGGTLVITGSHLVMRDILDQPKESGKKRPKKRPKANPMFGSKEAKRALAKAEPWFKTLFSETFEGDRIEAFMKESTSQNGHAIRVVEMTGEPGDVFVMHPWVIHTGAPNAGDVPRMMLLNFVSGASEEKKNV